MHVLLLAVAVLLTVATLVPLARHEAWWVRSFDFPRGQIFVLGVFVLVLYVSLWGLDGWAARGILGALVLALGLQAYRIWPYTPIGRAQVLDARAEPPEQTLSVVVANVLMSNRRTDRLLAIVRERDPDVVLLLEPDGRWQRELAVLEKTHPHTLAEPLDNRYGMLLYSRLEIVEPEIKHLVDDGIPSFHMQLRLRSGALVWFHALHPEPPSPTEADESTERDAELLIVGKAIEDRDEPTIVAGDMNDVAWSYTTTLFQRISGLLDPRRGRGLFNTFHAGNPLMRWPLDHVFHSDHFVLGEMARLPAFGSDHFPVYVRLVLDHSAEHLQEEPHADAEDREEAEEKIEAVDQKDAM